MSPLREYPMMVNNAAIYVTSISSLNSEKMAETSRISRTIGATIANAIDQEKRKLMYSVMLANAARTAYSARVAKSRATPGSAVFS
jgi:hypothetical protein